MNQIRATIRPTNLSPISGTPPTALLELTADAPAPRAPTPVAFALDRSGSMGGGRLEQAKRAIATAVETLDAGDSVHVVAFDDHIEDICGPLSPEDGSVLRERLRHVLPGGTTDIHSALARSYRHLPKGGHVLLLTDGHHNHGVQGEDAFHLLSAEARKQGVTTSCIGIGEGFQETLLQVVAEAGGGTSEYLRHDTEIPKALRDGLAAGHAIAASDAVATIQPRHGFDIVVLDPRARRDARGLWTIPLGSLRASWTHRVALAASPVGPSTGKADVASITIEYIDPETARQQRLQSSWLVTFSTDPGEQAAGEDLDACIRFELLANAHAGAMARRYQEEGRMDDALRAYEDRLREIGTKPAAVITDPFIQDDVDDLRRKIEDVRSGRVDEHEAKRAYFKDHATLQGDDEKSRKYREYKQKTGESP